MFHQTSFDPLQDEISEIRTEFGFVETIVSEVKQVPYETSVEMPKNVKAF